MTTREFKVRGIIPAIVTPFDQEGRMELDLLRREAEFLTRTGVDGLCVGGVASEMSGASPEEVYVLCKAVMSATDKRVIGSIFPDCNAEGFALAEACAGAGVAALLVAPPHYLFSPDPDHFLEMFAALRRRLTLPLLLSNSISTAQVQLSSISTLMNEELIDGVHQAGGNAHLLADLLHLQPRAPVYTGVEDLIYVAFLLGAEGAISALAAVFPEECVGLYAAARNGDFDRARELHEDLNRQWQVLNHPVEFLSRIKCSLALQGRPAGVPRSPYNLLSEEGRLAVQAGLKRARQLPRAHG